MNKIKFIVLMNFMVGFQVFSMDSYQDSLSYEINHACDFEVVKSLLLKYKLSITELIKNDFEFLLEPVRRGNIKTLKLLLQNGFGTQKAIYKKNYGQNMWGATLFHYAVSGYYSKTLEEVLWLIEWLVRAGFDVNVLSAGKNKCTPLWFAAQQGLPREVDVLLRFGADKTLKSRCNGKFTTPLEIAKLQVGQESWSKVIVERILGDTTVLSHCARYVYEKDKSIKRILRILYLREEVKKQQNKLVLLLKKKKLM